MLSLADKFREAGLATAEDVVRAEQTKYQIRETEAEIRMLQGLRNRSPEHRKRLRAHKAQLKILTRQKILAVE